MKDWVINLTIVLADGRVIKTRRRPRKSSAGYNLNSLFVGSEGTLGIVTEGRTVLKASSGHEKKVTDVSCSATLKLAVVPEDQAVAVVGFPSIRNAAAAAASVMQAGIPIQAMELLDEVQMRVINLSGSTAPRKWQEKPTLFFKFAGTQAGVRDCVERVRQLADHQGGSDFEFAADQKEQKLLWSARKESLWSMLALRKEGEDVCKSAYFPPWHSRLIESYSRGPELISDAL